MNSEIVNTSGTLDFHRIALLCRRAGTLPPLPGAALDLIKVIDGSHESVSSLERIISRDVGLTTGVLRAASTATKSGGHTSLRSAIALLGFRSVRSIGLSVAVQSALAAPGTAQALGTRISDCSFIVGQAARYLFARQSLEEQLKTGLTVDEIYAMGILSTLGVALLAKIAPAALAQTIDYARCARLTIHAAFLNLHDRNLNELGTLAAEAWCLPEGFISSQRYLAEPWLSRHEAPAWSCITLAREIAEQHGIGICDWPVQPASMPDVEAEVGVAPEEISALVVLLGRTFQS